MGTLYKLRRGVVKMPGKKSTGQQKTKKAPAPAPKVAKSAGKASAVDTGAPKKHPLFKAKPKVYGIGGALRPKGSRNLYRFVKWPRYIKLQRQKQVLLNRIKVPPAINQFRFALEKNHSAELFKLLGKYKPESTQDKKARLLNEAKARSEGKEVAKSKPVYVKYGLQNVTSLIEQNEAKLVVIAHDVDPIELVVWLPSLCQKKNIPYVIVKGKARLGQVVHKKTAAVLAITEVRPEHMRELGRLVDTAKSNFNDRAEFFRKTWGGLSRGIKGQHKETRRQRELRADAAAQKAIGK